MTRLELKTMLDNINMEKFAIFLGYKLLVKKSTVNWKVYGKEDINEEIIISKNIPNKAKSIKPPSNRYRDAVNLYIDTLNGFYNETLSPTTEEFKKGIITVQEFSNNIASTISINEYQNKTDTDTIIKNTYTEKELKEKYKYTSINPFNSFHTSYLTKRHINLETIDYFKKDIVITNENFKGYNFKNTAFLKQNTKNEIVGLLKRYYDKNNTSRKMEIGQHCLWHSTIDSKKQYKGIIIFENQIDALSYFQIHDKKDYIYTSIDGTINQEKMKFIFSHLPKKIQENSKTLKTKPLKKILAFDNDKMGYYYTLTSINYHKENPLKISFQKKENNKEYIKINDIQFLSKDLYRYENFLKNLIKSSELKDIIKIHFPESLDFNQDLSELTELNKKNGCRL